METTKNSPSRWRHQSGGGGVPLRLATSKPEGGATVGTTISILVGVGVGVCRRCFHHQHPPHYYDEVDEDAIASSPTHENKDDDNFTFSPASPPPLTQSTQEDMASIPRLYVFPDETVVVTADGEHIRIPDQHTITHPKPSTSTIEDPKPSTSASSSIITHPKPSTSTIEDPKPSTSTMEDDDAKEDPRKVCFLTMQTNIARLIAHQWRKSAPSTVEKVTVDVCRSLAVTVLSAPYQEILMKYVRCAIRRPR